MRRAPRYERLSRKRIASAARSNPLAPTSGLGERSICPNGLDDIAYCLAGCGGIRLVENKRGVGGVGYNIVAAVGRQGGQLVLRRRPGGVLSLDGCDDDQRLTGKVNKRRGLMRRP